MAQAVTSECARGDTAGETTAACGGDGSSENKQLNYFKSMCVSLDPGGGHTRGGGCRIQLPSLNDHLCGTGVGGRRSNRALAAYCMPRAPNMGRDSLPYQHHPTAMTRPSHTLRRLVFHTSYTTTTSTVDGGQTGRVPPRRFTLSTAAPGNSWTSPPAVIANQRWRCRRCCHWRLLPAPSSASPSGTARH